MITDRNGYLWISTDKGVVKYNGYECRTFTTADGLPTDDVWNLLEDLRGRIWLGCISGEMGYLYNDKYYKANLKNINGTVFPNSLRRCDSGIAFCSPHLNGASYMTLCVMANRDTIYGIPNTDKRLKLPANVIPSISLSINEMNEVVYRLGNNNHAYIKHIDKIFTDPDKIEYMPHVIAGDDKDWWHYKNFISIEIGRYCIMSNPDFNLTDIIFTNPGYPGHDSLSIKKFGISKPIKYISYDNTIGKEKELFVFTPDTVLTFSTGDTLRLINKYALPYSQMPNSDKFKPNAYVRHGLWDATASTSTNGAFISGKPGKFAAYPINLEGYKCINNCNDSLSLWWNGTLGKLILISGDKFADQRHLKIITAYINTGKFISRDSIFLGGSYSFYLDLKRNTTEEVVHFINIRGVALDKQDYFYAIDRSKFFSIYRNFVDPNTDPTKNIIDLDRFNGIISDNEGKTFWAYTDNKIVRCIGNKKSVYSKNEALGNQADKIESLSFDVTGRGLFIKTASQLYYADAVTMKSIPLHFNINLKGASINIYKDVLVIVGKFGVAFCKIMGKGVISKPTIYYNTKKIYYTEIASHTVSNGKVILLSDQGTYQVAVPDDKILQKKEESYPLQYNLVIRSNNNIHKHANGRIDTIDQVSRTIALDVVNPLGNGKINYYYRFNSASQWQKSLSGEILIPHTFSADKSYEVEVYFLDDAWKSDVIKLRLYIKPFWWQTQNMRAVIWAAGTLLVLLIIASVILITRRQVLRANEKKNMQMELELKAIYAQINPHFIFNTLTSALLLISRNRMDDAYTHISKFSKLLRSYLKSSRNKYVTIEEEIDNLKNYTELQQTRFKDRFQCEIITDAGMATSNIKIPSLLIQPFVENAINHGLVQSNETGKLIIEFRYKEAAKKVICIISDNGIGRHQAKINKKNTENTLGSYGNILIKDLVDIFNRYEKMHIDIRYVDKASPETGTSVIITITNPVIE